MDGAWYWVRRAGGEWFPALRDEKYCASGWTNEDTWEDFDGEVVEFIGPLFPRRHDSWAGHEEDLLLCDSNGRQLVDPTRPRDDFMDILALGRSFDDTNDHPEVEPGYKFKEDLLRFLRWAELLEVRLVDWLDLGPDDVFSCEAIEDRLVVQLVDDFEKDGPYTGREEVGLVPDKDDAMAGATSDRARRIQELAVLAGGKEDAVFDLDSFVRDDVLRAAESDEGSDP